VLHRLFFATTLAVTAVGLSAATQDPARVTFRSALDLVSVAVVVRDNSGRLVTGLRAEDFDVIDGGVARPVAHFEAGVDADARLAVLVDSSGSMVIGAKPARTRLAADLLFTGLRPADAATVFSFDSDVRRLTPYTASSDLLRQAVSTVVPYGTTCLFDAIVATAQSVREDAPRARAVVLLTDGLDTGSEHSADDAAAAATRLDMPVYVIGVGGLAGQTRSTPRAAEMAESGVADLARRTGGFSGDATSPTQLSALTRTILDELHHQYVVAFAAGSQPGWHQLQVRVRRGRVNARSRDGYYVR
jgi:Ca-activated chloride channel family protein